MPDNEDLYETPETLPSRRGRRPAPDYFTIGSRKADVTRLQGSPDRTSSNERFPDEELWAYNDTNDRNGYQSVVIFGIPNRRWY